MLSCNYYVCNLRSERIYMCQIKGHFLRKKEQHLFEKGILLLNPPLPRYDSIFHNNFFNKNFVNLRKSIGCIYRIQKASRIGPIILI